MGWLLSQATAARSGRLALEPDRAAVSPIVRLAYQAVLWLLCVHWFVSLPIAALGVALVASAQAAFDLLRLRSPFPGLARARRTLTALVRALLVELPRPSADLELDLSTQPALRAFLGEIAARTGAPAVERVLLAPGVECTVYVEASVALQLLGRSRRCLVLGVDLLRNASRRQLRPILAHEHGHYAHGDTTLVPFALAVRRSLERLQAGLADDGLQDGANPAWWLVRVYERMYAWASLGASRLAELQADRTAAQAYGSAGLEAALRFYLERQIRFEELVDGAVREAAAARRPLRNLYLAVPRRRMSPAELTVKVADLLHRPADMDDSHPTPAARLRWVRALGPGGRDEDPHADRPAWELVADGAGIEERLTARVRALVEDAHGVVLRG